MRFFKRRRDNAQTHKNEVDPRFFSLIKFIRWQGRIVVLLVVTMVVLFFVKINDIKWPTQKPVATAPPITEQSLQYNFFAYQNNQPVKQGDTVNDPELMLMGQVYNFREVIQKWPDLALTVNGAAVSLSEYGTCNVNFSLKPGSNVIETGLRANGQDYERKQIVITFSAPTGTSAASTAIQANKP